MIFASEKRSINKYQRDRIKITDKHVNETMKWITDRDITIMKLLLINGFLTAEQISMLAFNNLKPSSWQNKTNERLRRLYHAHCIDRFFPPSAKDAGSTGQHLILDHCGAKILQKHFGRTENKFRKKNYIPQDYKHRLKVLDFFSLLNLLNRQLGVVDNQGVGEIIQWKTERPLKFAHPDNGRVKMITVKPDAFCIYNAKGLIKHFYLECDNATEPIETLKTKLQNYKKYYDSGEWRQLGWARSLRVFPTVLFVFHEQELAERMASYSRTLNSSVRFLFTTYDNLFEDQYKEYVNGHGKRRLVLQERKIKILDEIWINKEGATSL